MPAANTRAVLPAGSGPKVSNNSSNGSPDQNWRSNILASSRARRYNSVRCTIIDHDQNDATINITMTSFTVKVARANNAQNEKSISLANAKASVSMITAHFFYAGMFRLWQQYSEYRS